MPAVLGAGCRYGEKLQRNKEKAALRWKASQQRLARNASARDLEQQQREPLLRPPSEQGQAGPQPAQQGSSLRTADGVVHGSASSVSLLGA